MTVSAIGAPVVKRSPCSPHSIAASRNRHTVQNPNQASGATRATGPSPKHESGWAGLFRFVGCVTLPPDGITNREASALR
jgi:hypothetical protein